MPTELTFTSLLYQHDGELNNEDATASALDSDEAVNAFKTYCEFYTDYKLDRETSVEQRFRTGESPIIIIHASPVLAEILLMLPSSSFTPGSAVNPHKPLIFRSTTDSEVQLWI